MGKLFYNMGLISNGEVITCSVSDIVGRYVGHTGPLVVSQFELGLGKVLFIDEAYRLAEDDHHNNSFGKEAIGEIVGCMTNPRYAGNMVVILAGYSGDMERLLQSNQGLRSRFATHIVFPNLTPDQCFSLMQRELGKLGIEMPVGLGKPADVSRKLVTQNFLLLSRAKGWANARDVKALANRVIEKVFIKAAKSPADEGQKQLVVSAEDLKSVVMDMWADRGGGGNQSSGFEPEGGTFSSAAFRPLPREKYLPRSGERCKAGDS